jgi:hypothetical protein
VWMSDVLVQLAWVYDDDHGDGVPGVSSQQNIRSPSWSWISVDYPVRFVYGIETEGGEQMSLDVPHDRGEVGDMDLVTYAQQSTEQFTLKLTREAMAQPTSFEAVDENGRIQVVMERRREWQVHELKGVLDPGRTPPKKIHLLRLAQHHALWGEVAIFLILKRVGMPKGDGDGEDLGTFKRTGIGSTSFEKMHDFLRLASKVRCRLFRCGSWEFWLNEVVIIRLGEWKFE